MNRNVLKAPAQVETVYAVDQFTAGILAISSLLHTLGRATQSIDLPGGLLQNARCGFIL